MTTFFTVAGFVCAAWFLITLMAAMNHPAPSQTDGPSVPALIGAPVCVVLAGLSWWFG